MNVLHANTDPNLLTRLKEMLGSSARADIAVGYFFMSGFDAIADDLARLDKVRILVGRSDRQVVEEVALGLQQSQAIQARLSRDDIVPRRQRDKTAQREVANIMDGVAALPQSHTEQAAVARLRDMVAVGRVQVRSYPKSPLHAKAYLCWYEGHAEPGAAVVGSSNLTLAGFSGNTELNVRVTGDAEMTALRDWFEALWDESTDIGDPLITELGRSWALAKTPPYHVYLKALYELYHADMGGSPDLPQSPRAPQLADFQMDAVSSGLGMIEKHGGCYIGDVVGLGKTYIGAELLRQLRVSYPHDGPPLILCPARLKPMWQRVNEDFALGAEVVSHNLIAAPADAQFDEELGRYVDAEPSSAARGVILGDAYPNRGPVLVDEAHNFRNINKRSVGLQRYLNAGDHKVVLLSATPQNLGPRDIYRQLRLFLHETEHGLNIEPLGLEDYFRCAEIWHNHRAECENYEKDFQQWKAHRVGAPPVAPDSPAAPRADIADILGHVFIRRRRKDIAELYDKSASINGKPISFPKPTLSNVHYRLDNVYEKAGEFTELQALLRSHTAARYRATDFIKSEAADKPEFCDLFRARNRIARLMGSLLFKRLESSIAAFRATLSSLMRSNRNFRQALEQGYVPIGGTATRLLQGESFDADEALEVLQQEEDLRRQSNARNPALVHSTDDFNTADWLAAIDADHDILSKAHRRVQNITPQDDDKLTALKRFLADPQVKDGKVLIFSEAETTVEYLYGELNPNDADPAIARLTGSSAANADSILSHFSPTWNPAPPSAPAEPEIRVLLATDVVSEGQNLQDCARILNYDLHWNPVRLIQRFGRIDRIGTEHTKINLHNMWPDTEVDAELDLTERLNNRIQSFHDLVGLDSRLLSEAERLNADAMYSIYADKRLPDLDDGLDEVAANQRAISLLQRIQNADPDMWDIITNLPDGIRSALSASPRQRVAGGGEPTAMDGSQATLPVDGAQPPLMSPSIQAAMPSPFDEPRQGETLVLLSQGDVKGCYAVGGDLNPRPISAAQLINAAECGPDEPTRPLPDDTNERVMAAFAAFQADLSRRASAPRRRPDSRNRRYISRRLNIAREQAAGVDQRRIDTLRRIFLADVPQQVETALTEIRNMGIEGDWLVRRLHALRERYRLNPPDDDSEPASPEPQIIRIVCSDGIV